LATAEIIPLFHPATFLAYHSLCILSINPVPPGLFRIIRRFYLLHRFLGFCVLFFMDEFLRLRGRHMEPDTGEPTRPDGDAEAKYGEKLDRMLGELREAGEDD
jgi:hypothetical protein